VRDPLLVGGLGPAPPKSGPASPWSAVWPKLERRRLELQGHRRKINEYSVSELINRSVDQNQV